MFQWHHLIIYIDHVPKIDGTENEVKFSEIQNQYASAIAIHSQVSKPPVPEPSDLQHDYHPGLTPYQHLSNNLGI